MVWQCGGDEHNHVFCGGLAGSVVDCLVEMMSSALDEFQFEFQFVRMSDWKESSILTHESATESLQLIDRYVRLNANGPCAKFTEV